MNLLSLSSFYSLLLYVMLIFFVFKLFLNGTLVGAFSAAVLYKVCTMYIPSYHPLKNFIILEKLAHLLVKKITEAAFSDTLDNSCYFLINFNNSLA